MEIYLPILKNIYIFIYTNKKYFMSGFFSAKFSFLISLFFTSALSL